MHAGGGVCAARAAGRAAVTPRPRQAPAVRAGCTAKAGAHTRRWVRRRAAVHGAPAACPASWLHPWVQGRDTTIPYPTLHPCWHAPLARSGLCCASRRRRRCSCIRIRRPAVWPPRPALQPRVSAVTRYLKPRIVERVAAGRRVTRHHRWLLPQLALRQPRGERMPQRNLEGDGMHIAACTPFLFLSVDRLQATQPALRGVRTRVLEAKCAAMTAASSELHAHIACDRCSLSPQSSRQPGWHELDINNCVSADSGTFRTVQTAPLRTYCMPSLAAARLQLFY